MPESILKPQTIFITGTAYTEQQLAADIETLRNGPVAWVGGLSPYEKAQARLELARYTPKEQEYDLLWATRGTRTDAEVLRQREAMQRLRQAGIPWLDPAIRLYMDAWDDIPKISSVYDPVPKNTRPPRPVPTETQAPRKPFNINQWQADANNWIYNSVQGAFNSVQGAFVDPSVVVWEYSRGIGDHSWVDATKAAGELGFNIITTIPGPDTAIAAAGAWGLRGLRGAELAARARTLIANADSAADAARIGRQLREQQLLDDAEQFSQRRIPHQGTDTEPQLPPQPGRHPDTPSAALSAPHTTSRTHTPNSTATDGPTTTSPTPTRTEPRSSEPILEAPGAWVPPQRPTPAKSINVTGLNPRRQNPFTDQELEADTVYNLPNGMRIFTDADGKPHYVEALAGNRIDGFTPELRHLVPNTTYRIDDRFTYKTDEIGRVIEAHADDLEYRPKTTKKSPYRNKGTQRDIGNLPYPNPENYHGGHLFADTLGGPGDGVNMVPMHKSVNMTSGEWGELEEEFRDALKADPNTRIQWNIKMDYSGGAPQPDTFRIEYQIGDGPKVRDRIENEE
ncbi:DNA/RNA non-specific endonuclease [Nocardia sp. 004]|uniref:DNA/RNA non-specific endonuclease n=1 Tax=Nocardia sp. 004 TaxID=3385978 RepID=UPI0039A047A1